MSLINVCPKSIHLLSILETFYEELKKLSKS